MQSEIVCFRCGESLDYLTLPLSRRDECRACNAPVHVCRMCVFFDTAALRQCLEDDAEDVNDKEKVNFCEWFKPMGDAFDSIRAGNIERAKTELDALFDNEDGSESAPEAAGSAADDLFK